MSQITIQDLSFTYDGDHTPVFEGLNLRLDTNWKLGLVGRNGRARLTSCGCWRAVWRGEGSFPRSSRYVISREKSGPRSGPLSRC